MKAKEIAKELAVSFFFTSFILFLIVITFGKSFNETFSKISSFFTLNYEHSESVKQEVKIDPIRKRLIHSPYYGEAFGTLSIPNRDIEATIYHGEGLEVLKNGLGHHSGSYFPGEGGTIIIPGHNTWGQFYNLPNVVVGDIVNIKTNYGLYHYKVTKIEVINADILARQLHLTTDIENIMLYTCYPLGLGYRSDRLVVYGELVGEEHE